MDKRIIFAVAGAGKTTYIVDQLSTDKRSLIVSYTENNYENLSKKIISKFGGSWPDNITLMTYFKFLYRFCYKPLLSDKVKAKGIIFDTNPNNYIKQNNLYYYINSNRYFYGNRLAFFMDYNNLIDNICCRLERYFDNFFIDEIQDIASRDFNFLEKLMHANLDMLFVGDFYQHTYDTSHDGNVNKNLFKDYNAYMKRFSSQGFTVDTTILENSWRCSKNICEFVTSNLGIKIDSNRDLTDNTTIEYVSDKDRIYEILENPDIIKLHYENGSKFGTGHKNWGASKGEDCYRDVCVILNKSTYQKYSVQKLNELSPRTRNKLYVAITRAHGNCFLIKDQ